MENFATFVKVQSMHLSNQERIRYDRQLILPEVGEEGQIRLKKARVLIVGLGGLGSPAALYLAAAGVGEIVLVDSDEVALSNLQRQILYTDQEVQTPKVEAARNHLTALNSDIKVQAHPFDLNAKNAQGLIDSCDLVIDGTDQFLTRYLINDVCVATHTPCFYGSVYRFEGQASIFYPPEGPCYRCLYPAPPPPEATPSCNEAGVLGVLPGVIGLVQATEAIKWILGIGTSLVGRLLTYDAFHMNFSTLQLGRRPDCSGCGPSARVGHAPKSGIQIEMEVRMEVKMEIEISSKEFADKLRNPASPFQLVDVRSREEFSSQHVEGALNIPLQELDQRVGEFQADKEIILYCQAGIRSLHALHFLKSEGFPHVCHLQGGLNQLRRDSETMDPCSVRVPMSKPPIG